MSRIRKVKLHFELIPKPTLKRIYDLLLRIEGASSFPVLYQKLTCSDEFIRQIPYIV